MAYWIPEGWEDDVFKRAEEYAHLHAKYFTGETSGEEYDSEYRRHLKMYLEYWEE